MTTARFALYALCLALCACPAPTDHLDNGLMVRDGLTLHAAGFPLAVAVDDTVEDDTLVPEVIAWWNDQAGFEVFYASELDPPPPLRLPDIVVAIGYTGGDYEAPVIGVSAIDFDSEGTIVDCQVTLSYDLAYDRDTMVKGGEHELGHCVALEDDPGPPVTVDLRSIMSDPLDMWGRLTDHDRDLVVDMMMN